jgi:hypothetical protein
MLSAPEKLLISQKRMETDDPPSGGNVSYGMNRVLTFKVAGIPFGSQIG